MRRFPRGSRNRFAAHSRRTGSFSRPSTAVWPTSSRQISISESIWDLFASGSGWHGISIVPQGGRTGLVGGAISQPGEIILSLRRMNRIERLDPVERVAVVGAGVTLEELQMAAAAHRLEPGIDLAARGSATIGG